MSTVSFHVISNTPTQFHSVGLNGESESLSETVVGLSGLFHVLNESPSQDRPELHNPCTFLVAKSLSFWNHRRVSATSRQRRVVPMSLHKNWLRVVIRDKSTVSTASPEPGASGQCAVSPGRSVMCPMLCINGKAGQVLPPNLQDDEPRFLAKTASNRHNKYVSRDLWNKISTHDDNLTF